MSLHDFIFSKKPKFRIPRHVFFWIVRALTFYVSLWGIYLSMPIENEDTTGIKDAISVGFIGSHILYDMTYTYLIVYVLIPYLFRPRKYLLFWILVTIYTGLILFIKIYLGLQLAGLAISANAARIITWGEIQEFMNSFGPPAICAVFIAIRMLKNWVLNQQQKKMLVEANAKAELEILKAQIHPHFLFNTLNNIYYFTLNRSFNAPVLLDKLSAIINYMIHDCEATFVPLESELAMLENYLELQGIRYGQRLNLNIRMPDSVRGKLVTPLLLIPFVENSFKHGASRMLDDPFISLTIQVTDGQLDFTLVNNKPLYDKNIEPAGGIGLSNVKKRLELLYPENHSLNIDQTVDTFTVKLTIPVFAGKNVEKPKPAYVS